jgi:hypothetical protein
MVTLEHEMTYRLKVTGPLAATEGSPVGVREYWEMTEGTLTGDRIKAKIVMPCGDWCVVGTGDDQVHLRGSTEVFVGFSRRTCLNHVMSKVLQHGCRVLEDQGVVIDDDDAKRSRSVCVLS